MRVSTDRVMIRKAKKEDVPFVIDIKTKGWQSAYDGIVDDKYLDNLDSERDARIANMETNFNTNGFIVAELDGEVVGFCRYIADNSFSPEVEDADCELAALYVKPDLKHHGIGTKLFDYVVGEFRKQCKTRMILWCLKDNEPSKRFYEKMGGKIIKEKVVNIGGRNYYECCFLYNL